MTTEPKRPRWLLRRPSTDASARLFCFPYSGCGATMYQGWPRRFGDVEVCLVQPPARQNRIRDPHHHTYEQLAEDIAETLPDWADRPFGFFGHCGGALPGVELARLLEARGFPTPRRVFVSSQVAPQDGPYGRLLELDRAGLGDELAGIIRELGGTPDSQIVELGLDLLVADIEANKRYRPGAVRLECGVTALGWTEDREIPMDLMQGWRATSDDVRHTLLDGDHFAFLGAPEALLAEIERDLCPPTAG